MAVQNGMFVFEVVVENVQSMVESRSLAIRSEFADIFSLELRDPKSMHIQMPEPTPLPPEPPGKKGKKKPKPKPKKGKKGKIEEPTPEPVIQSGQSVLFTSNAEFLIQNMKKYPLEISLWNKEDQVFVGSSNILWDPIFISNLERLANGENVEPTTLRETYNIFEEGKAKIMAKLALQIKLTYLGEKVCTSFRTLSEDPIVKKVLYTGINNKCMSYICNYRTTEEAFENNCNKIENNYIVDKSVKPSPKKINYADYKNAPGANLTNFKDNSYCCLDNADKPPNSLYKSPETCPDIDFIIDYVRKIIVSCNDNMRMLTPRPTLIPRVKATDIDRLCYCKETEWPEGEFAEGFKKEVTADPCPMCIEAGKRLEGLGETFEVSNIRGPCGRHDCRIARDLRSYIETLVEEDNKQFNLNDLVGPCGSKSCTLAEKIQEFIRHEGVFCKPATVEGLSTQCACVETMQKALEKQEACESKCSKDCSDSDDTVCEGKLCPYSKKKSVYDVYYFTVEFDNVSTPGTSTTIDTSDKLKVCISDCTFKKFGEKLSCSKTTCSTGTGKVTDYSTKSTSKCQSPVCHTIDDFPPSPNDSNIVIDFDQIKPPCNIETCDVADKVKEFIEDVVASKPKRQTPKSDADDPCYCDCVCDFESMGRTTYCAVCGGYEILGADTKDQPSYRRPHPCPVYHKLYDRNVIKTPKIWSDEVVDVGPTSIKSVKSVESKKSGSIDKKDEKDDKPKKKEKYDEKKQKKRNKFTINNTSSGNRTLVQHMKKPVLPAKVYPYPQVPKNMGWNWTAEDIPGLKPRVNWRPGAANRILVRRYRALREGLDVIAKKKRALLQKKKKIENKPTIIVTKKNGEYTVQMEVFKKYSKERLVNQYPYEDRPPLFYTIGRTEEENKKVQRQRDRRERRETRRKSRLLQSTFRDKCQEICLKAYNQAMGILPLPNPNDPECPCSTAPNPILSPPIDSCSCSDEETLSTSDTDHDEWVVEFTPPAAKYDGKAKNPPTMIDNETQYTYLDYKVKVLDKSGNQVPRFFTGIDGKELCSDLGGFWGPDHTWQEINKDGYIGPDNRWVPMNFIGPDGMFYSAEEGFFTDSNGNVLKIGIDGYINKDGKWAYYNRRCGSVSGKSTNTNSARSPKILNHRSGLDIKQKYNVKNNGDRKESPPRNEKNKEKLNKGKYNENTTRPKSKTTFVLNTAVDFNRKNTTDPHSADQPKMDRLKKDAKKIAKYAEIMQGLQEYDDFYEMRPLTKTNRATQNNMNHIKRNTDKKRFNTNMINKNMILRTNKDSCKKKPDRSQLNDAVPNECYNNQLRSNDISAAYCVYDRHTPFSTMDSNISNTTSQSYSRNC